MIKISELQVGSVVSNGEYLQIEHYHLNPCWDEDCIDFNPVELTEELLQQLGIYKIIESQHVISNWDGTGLILIDLLGSRVQLGGTESDGVEKCFLIENVKYLHQLQLIHKATTFKDLDVSALFKNENP